MTINQGNGMSKEAGVIREELSLKGFAICQINSYLKRLMRFQMTYVSHLFHRSQGGGAPRHLTKVKPLKLEGRYSEGSEPTLRGIVLRTE